MAAQLTLSGLDNYYKTVELPYWQIFKGIDYLTAYINAHPHLSGQEMTVENVTRHHLKPGFDPQSNLGREIKHLVEIGFVHHRRVYAHKAILYHLKIPGLVIDGGVAQTVVRRWNGKDLPHTSITYSARTTKNAASAEVLIQVIFLKHDF